LFIELSEFLRCPEPHDETFCVVAPDEMVGRMITRGVVGCPECRREYPIEDGVVRFGAVMTDPGRKPGVAAEAGRGGRRRAVDLPDPDVVQALLGLGGPGGFVVLVGTAARLAGALAERMGGVHFVGIDPPPDVSVSPALSLLVHPDRIPLRAAMARGVLLGAERATPSWIAEGTRVLLDGLRLVVAGDDVVAPGLERLAAGRGLWVGQKVGKREAGSGKLRT
jgi:uncharacterized protein YbaR (Trm112 family)